LHQLFGRNISGIDWRFGLDKLHSLFLWKVPGSKWGERMQQMPRSNFLSSTSRCLRVDISTFASPNANADSTANSITVPSAHIDPHIFTNNH